MATILIVDDEPANRLLLSTVLRSRAHDLVEASSGEDALRLARERIPDLIILDLHLPGMHGTQFMKVLRGDSATADLKVALYTASRIDAATRDFMELTHIDHVIEKPSEPETILRVIDGALS
jgi:two-component system, cell cycle sensor histidine kinase and response regulator CckA